MIIHCDICFEKSKYDLTCGHNICEECNSKCEKICLICNEEKKYKTNNQTQMNQIQTNQTQNLNGQINYRPYTMNPTLINRRNSIAYDMLRLERIYSSILPNTNTSSASVVRYDGVIPEPIFSIRRFH